MLSYMQLPTLSSFRSLPAAAFLLFASSSFSQVVISPPAPKAQETVRAQVAEGVIEPFTSDIYDFRATRVSMAANRITVVLVNRGRAPTLPEPSPRVDVPLGQFPAGEYHVEVRVEDPQGVLLKTVGTGSFSVTPKTNTDPLWNMTDLWWDPAESGWGLNIVQHPSGIIFATWFAYDQDGEPAWYVVPEGQWVANGVAYRGPLYRTTGPAFCFNNEPCPGLPFDPAAVTRTLVGEAVISLNPHDHDRAGLEIRVNGKTMTRSIRRQSF